jgi:hypothetical protein
MDKISIIVPVYNNEKHLERCLDSIVNQTYKNIEIIIVNDGSTDNSQNIIDRYQSKYSNIIKTFKQENKGVSSARKLGIKNSTGKYIGFVDSDDYIDSDMYEKLYNSIKKNKTLISFCDIYLHPINSKLIKVSSRKFKDEILDLKRNKNLLPQLHITLWDKLYDKNIIHYLDSDLRCNEDIATLSYLCAKVGKVSYVSETYYHCVLNPKGLSNTLLYSLSNTPSADSVRRVVMSLNELTKKFKDDNLFDEYKEEIESIYIRNIVQKIYGVLRNVKDKKMKKELVNCLIAILDRLSKDWRENKYYKNRFKEFEFNNYIWLSYMLFKKKFIKFDKKYDLKKYERYNINDLIKLYDEIVNN